MKKIIKIKILSLIFAKLTLASQGEPREFKLFGNLPGSHNGNYGPESYGKSPFFTQEPKNIEDHINEQLDRHLFGIKLYGHDFSKASLSGESKFYSALTSRVTIYDVTSLLKTEHPELLKAVLAVAYLEDPRNLNIEKHFKLAWVLDGSEKNEITRSYRMIYENIFFINQILPFFKLSSGSHSNLSIPEPSGHIDLSSMGVTLKPKCYFPRKEQGDLKPEQSFDDNEAINSLIYKRIFSSLRNFEIDLELDLVSINNTKRSKA